MLRTLLLSVVLLSAPAYGSALPGPVRAAIASLADGSDTAWAYTRETRDKLGHYVERFDPALPRDRQWQLLAFGGEPPSDEHLQRYRKNYDELFERDSPAGFELEDLIDPATLVEHSRSDDTIVYAFQPLADDGEGARIVQHMRGTMAIATRDNHLRSVSIGNVDKFSLIAVVRITRMSVDFEFAAATDDGPVVVVAMQTATEGRFMGIGKFSEQESVDYREFERRD